MTSPESIVDLVHAESGRLRQHLDSLPQDAWTRQSACERWQVRDVVAHLTGGAEMYTAWLGRGLGGDPSPEEGYPAAGAGDPVEMGEAIAERSIGLRERLDDGLLSAFGAKDDELNQLLSGISGDDWEKPCYHPASVFPARNFTDMRLYELAIHSWDIRLATDPLPHLHPQSVPRLVRFTEYSVGRLMRVEPTPPVRFRVAMTTAPWIVTDIIAEDGEVRAETATSVKPEVVFGCTSEDFVLLMAGRLAYDEAAASGRLSVQGDDSLSADFGRWLQGMLRPRD